MKWFLIIFFSFFTLFFIVGAISGHHTEPDKNKVFAAAKDSLKIRINDNSVFVYFHVNKDTVYRYDVKNDKLKQIQALGDYNDSKGLFPLEADQLILGALVGAGSISTIKTAFKKDAATEESGSKLKNVAAAILGVISGYSLGYYVGKPKVDSKLALTQLKDEKSWPPVIIELIRHRINALKSVYFNLYSDYVEKDNPKLNRSTKDFIENSGLRLYLLSKPGVKYEDLNCMLIYTEKKYIWYYLFAQNQTAKKTANLFNDDFFGIRYSPDSFTISVARKDYFKKMIDSLGKSSTLDSKEAFECFNKSITKKDVLFLSYLPSNLKMNRKISIGLFKSLLAFPNMQTYTEMKIFKSELAQENIEIDKTDWVDLNEMIANYPIFCMED